MDLNPTIPKELGYLMNLLQSFGITTQFIEQNIIYNITHNQSINYFIYNPNAS